MKLFIRFAFDGTAYHGYQVQSTLPTVQRALNDAARQLFGFDCDVMGCSRTDAGVHARMFCAAISKKGETDLPVTIPLDKIPRAMCAYLPEDISVYDAVWVKDEFHPRYCVRSKDYEYRFYPHQIRDPFEGKRSWHVPLPLLPDAVDRMNRAAQYFCGTHDFAAFMAQGSQIVETTRTVFAASVRAEDRFISFRVRADGFLYNMVRIMAGTLLDVALGKLMPEDIPGIIRSKDRVKAGRTAPPVGLYLDSVEYQPGSFDLD